MGIHVLSLAIAATLNPRALYMRTTNTPYSTIEAILVDSILATVANFITLDVVTKNATLVIFTTSIPSTTVL